MQIIVSKYVNPENHSWLSALKHDLRETEAVSLLNKARMLCNRAEHEYADSVLQVAMKANKTVFSKIKEESKDMCEALRELMAPEFEQAIKEAKEEVTKEVTREVTREVTKEVTKEVTREVTKKVTEEGIRIFIIDSIEEGRSEQVTVGKLVRHFHIDEDTAKKYFAKYSSATA